LLGTSHAGVPEPGDDEADEAVETSEVRDAAAEDDPRRDEAAYGLARALGPAAAESGSCVVGLGTRAGRAAAVVVVVRAEGRLDALLEEGAGRGGRVRCAPAAAVAARGRGGSGGLGALAAERPAAVAIGEWTLRVEARRGGRRGAGVGAVEVGDEVERVDERVGREGRGACAAAAGAALVRLAAAKDGLGGGGGRGLGCASVSEAVLPALERAGDAAR